MLKVKDLVIEPRGLKKAVVNNASFEVREKEIHALLGPNGSGKSTLAYSIMGIGGYIPVSGSITFAGKDITKLTVTERAKLGITLAWQEPVRFEGITVEDYIKVGMSGRDDEGVDRVLSLVDLSPKKFKKRFVDSSLSGGERKRVELAAVVAMEPKLMILDEPDSGLDVIVYDELYQIFDNIRNEINSSILIITHREESGEVADSATLIWEGRTILSGKFPIVMHKYCTMARKEGKCRRKSCLTRF